MAELATIARPYAQALFASMQTDASASAWLDELAAIASHAQLQQFAAHPKVSAAQVFDLITGLMKTNLPAQAQNFLRTLIANGRLTALPEIAIQFRALQNAHRQVSDAVVYSAFPLDDNQVRQIAGNLEKRFGRKLQLQVRQDAELIGGIRVVVGDEVLDTSVKARLEHMKSALTA